MFHDLGKVLRPVLTPWQMLSSRLKLDVQVLQRLSERFVSSSTLVVSRVSVWRAMVGEPGEILDRKDLSTDHHHLAKTMDKEHIEKY